MHCGGWQSQTSGQTFHHYHYHWINIIIIFTIVIIRQTVRLLMIMIIMVQNEDPTISASPVQSSLYLLIRSNFTSASTLGLEVVAAGCRGGKLTMCALSSRWGEECLVKVGSKLSWSCLKIASKLCQSCFRVVSKLSQGWLKIGLKLSQSWLKIVSKFLSLSSSLLLLLLL